jgi:hypothetical protein
VHAHAHARKGVAYASAFVCMHIPPPTHTRESRRAHTNADRARRSSANWRRRG